MDTVILSFFILFTLYFLWLLIWVYKCDFRAFLSIPAKKQDTSKPETKEDLDILGQSEVKFLDKLPIPQSIKPKWEISLDNVDNNEDIIEPDIEHNLSQDEQDEIIADQEEESFWQDDNPSLGFSIEDLHHAAETIAGQRLTDKDIERTKNTLKHFSEEWIELLSLHASNDIRIKDMLNVYLDKFDDNPVQKPKLKDFIVSDYIA